MSLKRQIAHNTIVQIVGKVISTILGLVSIGLLARYLGQEKFGWYTTAISLLQFVGIVIDLGLIPVTAQMMSASEFDKEKLFQNLLGFRFLTAVIFIGITPLGVLFLPYPLEVKKAVGLLAIGFIAVAMNQVFIGFYQAKLKMHIQALGEVVGRLTLVVGLWLLIYFQAAFLPIMIVITLNSIVYAAILWFKATNITKATFAFDKIIWKAIFKKSWPIGISIIFNVIYMRGDIILLSLFKSQNEVGLYGMAYRVLEVVAQTAMLIMGVLLPILAYSWSRNLKEEFYKRLQMSFDMMMVFAIPFTTASIVLAKPIIRLVGGDEFLEAAQFLQIISLAVFGVYVGAVFGHTAVAIDKQKQTIWIYLSNAVITLIGYLIFIPKFGATGAAWMTVFSELYAGFLLALVVSRFIKTKVNLKIFYKSLLSASIMAIFLIALRENNILLLIPIGGSVYFASLYILKGFSKETIKEITSIKK